MSTSVGLAFRGFLTMLRRKTKEEKARWWRRRSFKHKSDALVPYSERERERIYGPPTTTTFFFPIGRSLRK
jgi:hypothetical protein